MNQFVLIVAISIIAAMVAGSTVFFVWTLVERLLSRPTAAETAEVTDNEEQERAEPASKEGQQK